VSGDGLLGVKIDEVDFQQHGSGLFVSFRGSISDSPFRPLAGSPFHFRRHPPARQRDASKEFSSGRPIALDSPQDEFAPIK
jgi:hypothetical protein